MDENKTPLKFEIHIVCTPETGEVQVRAPMSMKPACVKALAAAMQIIVDWNPNPILAPHPVLQPLRNGTTKH